MLWLFWFLYWFWLFWWWVFSAAGSGSSVRSMRGSIMRYAWICGICSERMRACRAGFHAKG